MIRRLVAADWSKHSAKRWYCVATPTAGGYDVDGPHPVKEPFLSQWENQPTLIGVDFAIGLPDAYCQRARVDSFQEALPNFDDTFFTVSDEPCLQQPFYPRTSTGSRAKLQAITGELLRTCDRLTKACPMFWTLGAQQVGRATIHGWQTLLRPRTGQWKLWPFDGEINHLPFALAEVYPRLAYQQVIGRRFSKADRTSRSTQASAILVHTRAHNVNLSPNLQSHIEQGFETDDAFDACLAVLGMIHWTSQKAEAPQTELVRRWEGWIYGLDPNEPCATWSPDLQSRGTAPDPSHR